MSKPFNPIEEGKTEGDVAKRILRAISDVVRSLDDKRSRAQAVTDLFSPAVEVHRSRLHELTYRLILIDPQGYGKRGEETLWKKGYHDVFITARQLKTGPNWRDNESALVRGLLLSGLGHYQHLIFRLQADYALHIEGFVDFALPVVDYGIAKGQNSGHRLEEAPWADALVGRCLLCLGDLSRYMRELQPGWDVGAAERYYLQAALLDDKQGRPYNQLGTLAGSRNHGLDSAFYYMLSLACAETFQGAEGNLFKVLEKNINCSQMENFGTLTTTPVQKTIIRFLALINSWYYGKTISNSFINEVCENLQTVMPRGICSSGQGVNNWEAPFLSPPEPTDRLALDTTVKIVAMLFLCWEKTRTIGSQQFEVTSCLLSIMDLVVQHLLSRREKIKVERKKLRRRRRRRRRCSEGSSGSDESAEESVNGDNSEDSPDVSSAEEGEDEIPNGHVNGVNGTSGKSLLSWLEDDTLGVLNILCAWFRHHGEALSGNKSKNVLGNLVVLLNEISLAVAAKRVSLMNSAIPTIEDSLLRGFPSLKSSQANLDWSVSCRRMTTQELSALRAFRVLEQAKNLAGVSMNSASLKYQLVDTVHSPSPVDIITAEGGKGKLMKNMGQLWLKAEVRELENRVRKTPNDYSPYVVVDSEALIEHMPLIRQIVGSKQFIVVIPIIVIGLLDECKKESSRARETIRWLETQFQYGNRHLRSQKTQETCSLGVIKYPKKKDKEAWSFFQIMECCSYLKKQSELRCKKTGNVIFLTGVKDRSILESRGSGTFDFSPSGLASTFGVTLEHVETFHSKWKLSSKSHG